MVRLACPRCRVQVEADPNNPPPCPNCGFQGSVGEPAGPQAPPSSTPPYQPGQTYAPAPPSYAYPTRPEKPFGGFWIRFAAYLIDFFVFGIPFVILLLIIAPGMVIGDPDAMLPTRAELLGNLFSIIASWLYFAIMESSKLQGTVGKMAAGLKVTDLQGRRISFARATGRYFAQILSAIILLIGYFMIGWTRYKQGLHDMIAGTLVYKKHHVPQQAPPTQEADPWQPQNP